MENIESKRGGFKVSLLVEVNLQNNHQTSQLNKVSTLSKTAGPHLAYSVDLSYKRLRLSVKLFSDQGAPNSIPEVVQGFTHKFELGEFSPEAVRRSMLNCLLLCPHDLYEFRFGVELASVDERLILVLWIR
ncbi:hypothetical protein KA529_01970 [Candidatus Saccharibacteria bacterium]|nr:hypothetical protein [Candidatus Saccharibacteria bacterium]